MTAPKPREVKIYTLEIGYVEKTSLHGHDTGVTQHDVVFKSDYDSLKADLEALVKMYGTKIKRTCQHDDPSWCNQHCNDFGSLAREIGDRNGIKYE